MLESRSGNSLKPRTMKQVDTLSRLSKQDHRGEKSDEITKCKNVRFSNVDVRDYSLCLGDNPSVSIGAPISLDWNYDAEFSYKIDRYEHERVACRQDSECFKIPSQQRDYMLKKSGYSREEINKQVKKSHRDKQKRILSKRSAECKDLVKHFITSITRILDIPSFRKQICCFRNVTTKVSKKRRRFESERGSLDFSGSSKKSDVTVMESIDFSPAD